MNSGEVERDSSSIFHGAGGLHAGLEVMEKSVLFSNISNAERRAVFADARIKEYARGQLLYLEGDSVQQVPMLAMGLVKSTRLGMNGSEVILRLSSPGDVLGVTELFATGRHCSTAHAFRSCKAIVWNANTFRDMVKRHPILQQNMVRILYGQLEELEDRFYDVATGRVAERIGRQLTRLVGQIGREVDGTVVVYVSREELAQMTGTTLFTVSRQLSLWESKGIVRAGREAVAICDLATLSTMFEEK
jgi:CRP-like cAMP-binding protein